jgi:L-threonylcarbamoyladenylate synthase
LVDTKIIKINSKSPDRKLLWYIAKIIESGGIVVYPTETSYGIGTNAVDVAAVKRLRAIRKPSSNPISIIVSSVEMMRKYGVITKQIESLAKKFMPGPLTIITNKKETIPKILNKNEIAFRISSHPVAAMIAEYSDVPITAASANPEGLPPAFEVKKVMEYFGGKVDVVVDSGKLKKTKASTMVDMKAREPKLIRKGPVSFSKIKRAIKKL